MYKLILLTAIINFFYFGTSDPQWDAKLKAKIVKVVSSTYGNEDLSIGPISYDQDIENQVPLPLNTKLFEVKGDDTLQGYIYVSQANSMKNVFDYIILLSPELEVVNTKVLIYRESHGRQIGSKRWLSQFFGLTSKDRPVLGENIDGISGATISTTSMTNAVNQFLVSLDFLQKNNLIKA